MGHAHGACESLSRRSSHSAGHSTAGRPISSSGTPPAANGPAEGPPVPGSLPPHRDPRNRALFERSASAPGHRSPADPRHAARPRPAHRNRQLQRLATSGADHCSPPRRCRAARISRNPIRSRTRRHGISDKQARRDPRGGLEEGDAPGRSSPARHSTIGSSGGRE